MSYLDEVLALRLRNEWLELGGGECVDQASLGDDEKKYLSTGKNRQLVGLKAVSNLCCSYNGLDDASRGCAVRQRAGVDRRRTFFMIPALRLEKVM